MRVRVLVCVLAVWAAGVVAAHAQSAPAPFPGGVELSPGQWVPCSHPLAIAAGRGCGQPTPTAPTPAPVPTDAPVCDPRPNPYVEPDRAAACAAWDVEHRPTPPLPTFVVGGVYRDPYDDFRVTVLDVTRSLEGVPVVTVQRVKPANGHVFSFRVDTAEAQRWERIQ